MLAVKDIMDADHNDVITQIEQIVAMHNAPAFAEHRRKMEEEGLSITFYAVLTDKAIRYRRGLTDRDNLQRGFRYESADVRKAAAQAAKWIKYLHSKVSQIIARRRAEASKFFYMLQIGEAETGTPTVTRKTMDDLISALVSMPETAALGLYATFLDEGREYAARIPAEQADAGQANISRQVGTDDLYLINDELTWMMEELVATRDAVELRWGIELPGFEFELLRSIAARRRSPVAVESTEGDQPPAEQTTANKPTPGFE
jgi:hypothetical protein